MKKQQVMNCQGKERKKKKKKKSGKICYNKDVQIF